MEFSPLKNELPNNYADVASPQPLLAQLRRYSGDCGGDATECPRAGLKSEKPPRKTRPRGRVLFALKLEQEA
jgi:hypothetical protein